MESWDREALYAEVWEQPLTKVAPKYGRRDADTGRRKNSTNLDFVEGDSPGIYLACLPWSWQRATRSAMFASPTHMTVSAAPQ